MDCDNKDKNMEVCNCTYPGCPRKGICCECVAHHRKLNQLPACFFPAHIEKTYDRSYAAFIRAHSKGE